MKLSVLLGAIILAVATAALVVTNPGPEAYADYVGAQAQTYLTDEVCTDLPAGISDLLGGQCGEMVQSLMPELDTLIRDRTERLNFAIGSIYRTSLGIPNMPMLPEYRIESLGILNRFFTYSFSQTG
ncbi:DUF4359 domain-containing protein [Leptolyngbya iicbica]|uniref:DUF4359 domain-containing protein n=2 Tax=Cyanophyceae TaxID=3028117 RepID=A0A4Q7E6M7_9CYAN|nr:DUF4359 domain-containing protein [Leptolyngbya sp. LK]RZM77898.1 DUF4359 domain-containing protein [Leptolyngbya sp. LK]